MSKKVWRPEISTAAWSAVFGIVVLGLLYWIHDWYVTTNRKVDELHAARQEDSLKKEADRDESVGALARDVQRHQRPTWAGMLDAHDMSPWVTVPTGYAWTFDAKEDVKIHYRTRNGALAAETFPKTAIGKILNADTEKIKIENLADTPQPVKLWVYRFADDTARVKMPGGEVLTFGAPTKPRVESDHGSQPRTPVQHASLASQPSSDDNDYQPATASTPPPQPQPRPAQPKVISNGPPGQRFDMVLECGDRQLAIPEPHESPDYSAGLYGVTVRLPRDCWSEWLVMPQGYTPYVMDISGFSQTGYEIYPAHKGNAAIASNTGRVPFTQDERAAFQSIRFQAGFISGNSKNVVKLLFTKP